MIDKCCVCGRIFKPNDKIWVCEDCEGLHCPGCSGDSGGCSCTESCGEDDSYSYCQKCVDKVQE